DTWAAHLAANLGSGQRVAYYTGKEPNDGFRDHLGEFWSIVEEARRSFVLRLMGADGEPGSVTAVAVRLPFMEFGGVTSVRVRPCKGGERFVLYDGRVLRNVDGQWIFPAAG